MTRISNEFVRNHFQADYVEDIGGGWIAVRQSCLIARNILANPAKFPKANFEYLEKQDLELTCFLLGAPIQFIV